MHGWENPKFEGAVPQCQDRSVAINTQTTNIRNGSKHKNRYGGSDETLLFTQVQEEKEK